MLKDYDIAVIGAGAGGLLFTALTAKKQKNLKIALFEKNDRVGKKLLVTGNGRCNLTNIYSCEENYHGSFKPYVSTVLEQCPPNKVTEVFAEMGLMTHDDSSGRVYPRSNQASSVLDVLRFNCQKSCVDVFCSSEVINAERKNEKYLISTTDATVWAKSIVIATGGAAAPKAGGGKSGYQLLKGLGHKVIPPSPALCPLISSSALLKLLKGVRVQGKVSLLCDGKELHCELGEIQFNESNLSGICVFNLSQYIDNGKDYSVRISLLPDLSFNDICNSLKNNRETFKLLEADCLMTGIFHKRLAQALLKASGIDRSGSVGNITDKEIKSLASLINRFDFKVTRPEDFGKAQVTKGGVAGYEITPHTMESRISKGLYIIGEAIDCNADCGGHNLQFAFATGYIAAENYDKD